MNAVVKPFVKPSAPAAKRAAAEKFLADTVGTNIEAAQFFADAPDTMLAFNWVKLRGSRRLLRMMKAAKVEVVNITCHWEKIDTDYRASLAKGVGEAFQRALVLCGYREHYCSHCGRGRE